MRDATRPVSPGSAEASSPWTAACSFRTGPRAWLTVGALRAAPIFLWPGWISIFVLQPLHHHMPGIFARRCASVSVKDASGERRATAVRSVRTWRTCRTVPDCIRSIRRRRLRQECIAGFFHVSRGPAGKMAIRLVIRHRVYATGRFHLATSRRAGP